MIEGLFSHADNVNTMNKSVYPSCGEEEKNSVSLKGEHNMAQKVRIELTDDIDGSEATSSVRFALDNASYEIDLNQAHEEELRNALEKFIKAGRKVSGSTSGRGGKRGGGSATSDKEETRRVRNWAAENGIAVNTRGRISSDVLEKFHAAHGKAS